jgi:hypothetical protein
LRGRGVLQLDVVEHPSQVLEPSGGEVVEDSHLVAVRNQPIDEVRADEAGPSSDEDSHPMASSSACFGFSERVRPAHARLFDQGEEGLLEPLHSVRCRHPGSTLGAQPGAANRVLEEGIKPHREAGDPVQSIAGGVPDAQSKSGDDSLRVMTGDDGGSAGERLQERDGQRLVERGVDKRPSGRKPAQLLGSVHVVEQADVAGKPVRLPGIRPLEVAVTEHVEFDVRKPARQLYEHPRPLDGIESTQEDHPRASCLGRQADWHLDGIREHREPVHPCGVRRRGLRRQEARGRACEENAPSRRTGGHDDRPERSAIHRARPGRRDPFPARNSKRRHPHRVGRRPRVAYPYEERDGRKSADQAAVLAAVIDGQQEIDRLTREHNRKVRPIAREQQSRTFHPELGSIALLERIPTDLGLRAP